MKNIMKKIICIAIAIIMCLLCSCNKAQSNNEPSKTTEINFDDRTPFATSKEQFIEKISKLIDVSKYDFMDYKKEGYDSTRFDYTMKSEIKYQQKFDFDYKINFNDGSTITLPATFNDVAKSGWETELENDYQVSNQVQRGLPYTNSFGEEIQLWTQNHDDSEDEKNIDLSDCIFHAIELTMYDIDYTGEKGSYKKSETAPSFRIMNDITHASTIEDVIKALGEPNWLSYDIDDNEIRLHYFEEVEKGNSSIDFYFVANGNYMSRMKYEYSFADIK